MVAEEYKVMANKTLIPDHWPAIGCDGFCSLTNYWPSEALFEVSYFSQVLTDIEVAQRRNQMEQDAIVLGVGRSESQSSVAHSGPCGCDRKNSRVTRLPGSVGF
jgi:hypothetical protein